MKKTTILILALCVLFTCGCAGEESSTAAQVKIADISSEGQAKNYIIKDVGLLANINIAGTPIKIADASYFIGTEEAANGIYKMQEDYSEYTLLAAADPDSEWNTIFSLGENICVWDENEDKILVYDLSGHLVNNFILPEDVAANEIIASEDTIFITDSTAIYAYNLLHPEAAIFKLNINMPASLGKISDGRIAVCQKTEDEKSKISIINEEDQCLADIMIIDKPCRIIGSGVRNDLYLQVAQDIYTVDVSNSKITKLMSMSLMGIQSGKICEGEDDDLLYSGKMGTERVSLKLLTTADSSSVAVPDENVVLTLATNGPLPFELNSLVLKWNQNNISPKIEVKDYSVYNADTDTRGAQLQIIADAASGDLPDLYSFSCAAQVNEPLNAALFAKKGLLTDLYTFIDNDEELNRGDFFSGPLKALETENSLYSICPAFVYLGTAALASEIDDINEITFEALNEKVSGSTEFTKVFDHYFSRTDWLNMMLCAYNSKLIDWDTASCNFNSELFIRLLEYSKEFPQELNMMGGKVKTLVENSESLLYTVIYRDITEPISVYDAYGENNCRFVGLPELGSVLMPSVNLGISSQSEHKEECWMVLRELLLPEGKSEYGIIGIPLREDNVQVQMNEFLAELGTKSYSSEEIEAMEQIMKEFVATFDENTNLYVIDDKLWSIVIEEADRYYSGNKTSEEAAAAIQSRASIYVAEQS